MGNVEIPDWLKALPLAPEFRPTDTEFADPIAYISKIEKECSAFGICKIIPPLPKPSKKYVFNNLNKSLLKCPELGRSSSSSRLGSSDVNSDGEVRAVFTTRQQELGQSVKKSKGSVQNSSLGGAHKQVWQSGEIYTLEQFESKSKVFSKTQLGMIKEVTPLVIEAMFWKATSEKPIYLEYANDVPGSGFGEPEGQIRYFHRRRRKRNFFTRNDESSSCKTNEMGSDGIDVSPTDDGKDPSLKSESDICLDNEPKSPGSPPTLPANEVSRTSKKKSQSSCYDKEGTAGWKISNSPWNLQVISRSPGSLTRFMPDDIPGVTSPMVYIGMLFSWFAWHVEDHELHSMNFLHTGSSKTWYSVPGDYAFTFEEVVRTEAYGANVDRIAALAMLGEKTTVMSPEVVVSSGIPCCRLIQNPGEFVVTFPRAYHIGFSHGFNCGEAANFGTPLWLNVAKEAAVRRAAMNYLPMLSHQQLLYLLTMSFVSRVPRSLLPGVRSSRLRDRQKEEREILVKKAFIEDILHENNTLSVLLGKDSGYRAILWNQDLLTSSSKEAVPPSAGASVGAILTEKPSHVSPKEHSNEHTCLLEEMSLYMENLNDLYLGSDDLSCDFQVDSGTLACVACGILGFPFMSVVQPSEKASLKLVQEVPGTSGYLKPCSSHNHDTSNNGSFPENPSAVLNALSEMNLPLSSIVKSMNGWNIHNKFLRPRSFCLEHAVEIVELLQCKGGANVLVICHSDYQKIKAHATTIAEEVSIPFGYNEVPIDIASKEDLNMIDLAIEDGVHKESGEDWTSKLGINLRHCVKIRKNSTSKQVQHALTLGGLFSNKCQGSGLSAISNKCPALNFPAIGWKLRRSRSRKIYLPAADSKPHDTTESKNDDTVGKKFLAVKKEVKLIQYSRRNTKTKLGGSSGISKACGSTVALSSCEQSKIASENKTQNVGSSNSVDFSPSIRVSGFETSGVDLEVSVRSVETHTSEETNTVGEARGLAALADSEMQTEPNAARQYLVGADGLGEKHQACLVVHSTEKGIEIHEEKVPSDENVLVSSHSDPGDVHMSLAVEENVCINGQEQVFDLVQLDDVVAFGVSAKPESCTMAINNETLVSVKEFPEGPRETCSAEESSNVIPLVEVNEHPIMSEALPVSTEVTSQIPGHLLLSSDKEPQLNVRATLSSDELASSSLTQMEVDDNPSVSVDAREPLLGDATSGDLHRQDSTKNQSTLVEDHSGDGLTDDDIEAVRLVKEEETSFRKYSRVRRDTLSPEDSCYGGEASPRPFDDRDNEITKSDAAHTSSDAGKGRKRSRELEQLTGNKSVCNSFIRGPCEGLRPRAGKDSADNIQQEVKEKPGTKIKRSPTPRAPPKVNNNNNNNKIKDESAKSQKCDIEGCRMSFETKGELSLHKRNRCPREGCGKRFRSHKYAMVHERVHGDERPLKCPWEGCEVSFKWAWARTEHMRVHTGEKPYKCKIDGCGLSFRFVSDFSRHRRKTGHYVT